MHHLAQPLNLGTEEARGRGVGVWWDLQQ
jgi:hypothetical protein